MRIILAIVNFIALIGGIFWWVKSPDYEPAVTSIVLFGALLAQIFTSDEIKSKFKLVQKSKKESHNYQSAGDQTITDNKTIQSGGDHSQQFQADKMIVHVGIDEKRAREIYQEMNVQLKNDYSKEALDIANTRVTEFENRLMSKMDATNGALEAFADPSFQLLLVKAQKAAASTERPADYDLLSELLMHRFQKGENRTTRAGVSRAVEIVDEISDDALLGLTVSHAVTQFSPVSGDINQGLTVLDNLFGKILYGKLPVGNGWLDHLDILDAVRVSSFGNLKKVEQYYPETLVGYVDVGIEKQSENHDKAIEILNNNRLPQNILIDHAFNGNFVRINIPNKNAISSLILQQQISHNGNILIVPIGLSKEQVAAINSVYELYKQDGNVKQQNINAFMEEWNKRPNLKILRDWWDNINISFQITSVGKVLAHSNAQRCDNGLPPLD